MTQEFRCSPCRQGHDCRQINCQNDGVANYQQGTCACGPNWTGECCNEKRCFGGGTLENGTCICRNPARETGDHCEIVRCDNGGTSNAEGKCSCLPWSTGSYCEVLQCTNNGTMHHNGTCKCVDKHFQGLYCEQLICENDGVSKPDDSSACLCTGPFHGRYCETKRCLHNGWNDANGDCVCANRHYSGLHCETLTCEHGEPSRLTPHNPCRCPAFFEGNYCERLSTGTYLTISVGAVLILAVVCCIFWYQKSYRSRRRRRPYVRAELVELTPRGDKVAAIGADLDRMISDQAAAPQPAVPHHQGDYANAPGDQRLLLHSPPHRVVSYRVDERAYTPPLRKPMINGIPPPPSTQPSSAALVPITVSQ